jgi:predicted Zn-dependent peptidase
MEKARNTAVRSLVTTLGSSLQRAITLAEFAQLFDDPGLINTRYQRLAAITPPDLQRVSRQYLTPRNRSVVITNPKPGGPPKPPDAAEHAAGSR